MSALVRPGEGFKDNTAYIEIGSEDERWLSHLRKPETQEALRWAAVQAECEHKAAERWPETRGAGFDAYAAALRGLLLDPP